MTITKRLQAALLILIALLAYSLWLDHRAYDRGYQTGMDTMLEMYEAGELEHISRKGNQ